MTRPPGLTGPARRVDPALVTDAERADNPPVRSCRRWTAERQGPYLGPTPVYRWLDEAESGRWIDRLIRIRPREERFSSIAIAGRRMTSFFATTGRCATARQPAREPPI